MSSPSHTSKPPLPGQPAAEQRHAPGGDADAARPDVAETIAYEPTATMNAPAGAKPPQAKPAAQPSPHPHAGGDEHQEAQEETAAPRRRLRLPRNLLAGTSAFFSSLLFHLVLLILLALIFVPEVVKQEVLPIESAKILEPEEEEERLETQILDENLTPSIDQAVAVTTSESVEGGAAGVVVGTVQPPKLDLVAKGEKVDTDISVDSPFLDTPPSRVLIEEAPAGLLGDPREIVDDYQEAMDRITRELLMLLDKHRVLVIWCFDQSESMKDDQQEIRDRIYRVYSELGLSGRTEGGALTTAVTSYGQNFAVHTEKPTARIDKIRSAITSVPIDNSGKEMMCNAIGRSIALHAKAAKGRQMVLILVTDETGEKEDNILQLEAAVAQAKEANCICYVLGREAVFGYPYAFMRWKHPGTHRIHWLPVDRGPETAFVEQLQTNGFRRRHDAFPSGFGPYEQTRLVRETGGVFFMLPSLETSIVRGENRRYELEAMRAYRPDLRSRAEIAEENVKSLLRTRINEVIASLNPYNKAVQPHIEMRVHFSRDPAEFAKQVQQEKVKAARYVQYLIKAENVFASDEMKYSRTQETSPRWQANYDLLYAQILAYKVRIYEYGAYLEWFMKHPQVVPLTKPPNLKLVHWDITTRQKTLTGEQTESIIAESKRLFQQVIDKHPGTPWAARAQRELRRGFGVELHPDYDPPYRKYDGPPIPIPKL